MIGLWTNHAHIKSNKHFEIKISSVFSGGLGFNFSSLIIIAVSRYKHTWALKFTALSNTLF
jgi:hypothetical protein